VLQRTDEFEKDPLNQGAEKEKVSAEKDEEEPTYIYTYADEYYYYGGYDSGSSYEMTYYYNGDQTYFDEYIYEEEEYNNTSNYT
jgi:hypothetical protein